jgi:Nucleotide modification associated domain 2
MPRIYFYKLTADSGGAPCVKGGLLSLAICKPMLRGTAEIGDLIFGFAANSLHRDNRLLFVARVTNTLRNGGYYKDSRYAQRGDCIYRFRTGRFVRRKDAQHHPRPEDLTHDLGTPPNYAKANVVLSKDFRYFGRAGTSEYKYRFARVKDAVEALGRGHRVRHGQALYKELLDMADWVWQSARHKVMGLPTSAPSRQSCHRGGFCGVLTDDRKS